MQRSPLSPICPILSHQHLGAPACRFLVACVCQSVYQPICPAFDGDMKRRVNPRERVILSSSLQREDNLLAMLAKMWIDRKGALTLFLSASVILFARGSEAHSDPIGHCPPECKCTDWEGNSVVDCRNLQLTTIPHLPSQVMYLHFGGNNLTQITSTEGFQQYGYMRELYLENNKISTIHRNGLPESLETLHLQNNRLERVDRKTFRRRKKLVVLNLNDNLIKEVEDYSLPFTLENLQMKNNLISKVTMKMFSLIEPLRAVYLTNNRIHKVQEGAFPESISILNLGRNRLQTIGKEFSDLPQLRVLNLYSNRIRRLDAKAFIRLPLLRELSLLDNQLTEIRPKQFATNYNLLTLNLFSNSIRTFDETALPFRTKLQRLYLQKNPLTCDCRLQWLPIMLEVNNLNSKLFDWFFKDSSVADEDWPFDYPNENDIRCASPSSVADRRVTDNRVTFECETDLPTAVVKETVRVTVGTAAAASAVYNDFWTWAENSLPRTMNTRRPEYDPAANADSIPVPNDSQVTHDKLLEILIKKIDNMSARSSADRLDHTSLLYLLLAASVLLLFR